MGRWLTYKTLPSPKRLIARNIVTYTVRVSVVQEKELIDEIEDLFGQTLGELEDQLDRDKNLKYRLEENWSNKNQSMKIDTINLGLNIQSPIIMSHTDVIEDSEK